MAQLEIYNQQGVKLFDSDKPRLIRLHGTHPITWVYDKKVYDYRGDAIHQLLGYLPFTWNFTRYFTFGSVSGGKNISIRDGYFISSVHGRSNDTPQVALNRFFEYNRIYGYNVANIKMYTY